MRRDRPWYAQPWAIALLVVTALTVLAGTVLAAGTGSTAGPATGRTGLPGGKAGGRTGGGAGTAPSCPGGSMEGCYDRGEMQAFLNQAVTVVHRFADASLPGAPKPAGYRLIATGDTASTRCGTLDATAYAYCPADDSVYIGQSQLWSFYSELGDAAAVVGLAHEYGHHLQAVAGVPDERTSRGRIAHENQADCIAGAFVGFAQQQGMLEDDDVQDINGLLGAIASSEDDPGRDHGTLAERRDALSLGVRAGLRGCSGFFPATPVHAGS